MPDDIAEHVSQGGAACFCTFYYEENDPHLFKPMSVVRTPSLKHIPNKSYKSSNSCASAVLRGKENKLWEQEEGSPIEVVCEYMSAFFRCAEGEEEPSMQEEQHVQRPRQLQNDRKLSAE